jgi:hypothetical protein
LFLFLDNHLRTALAEPVVIGSLSTANAPSDIVLLPVRVVVEAPRDDLPGENTRRPMAEERAVVSASLGDLPGYAEEGTIQEPGALAIKEISEAPTSEVPTGVVNILRQVVVSPIREDLVC